MTGLKILGGILALYGAGLLIWASATGYKNMNNQDLRKSRKESHKIETYDLLADTGTSTILET